MLHVLMKHSTSKGAGGDSALLPILTSCYVDGSYSTVTCLSVNLLGNIWEGPDGAVSWR